MTLKNVVDTAKEKFYQTIIVGTWALVGFLGGFLLASMNLHDHANRTGHPVMDQRVTRLEQDVKDFGKLAKENHELLILINSKIE